MCEIVDLQLASAGHRKLGCISAPSSAQSYHTAIPALLWLFHVGVRPFGDFPKSHAKNGDSSPTFGIQTYVC